ncbi:MAG TPA: hypothetical protein VGL61_22275 [Kofleriaceae bacterium]
MERDDDALDGAEAERDGANVVAQLVDLGLHPGEVGAKLGKAGSHLGTKLAHLLAQFLENLGRDVGIHGHSVAPR